MMQREHMASNSRGMGAKSGSEERRAARSVVRHYQLVCVYVAIRATRPGTHSRAVSETRRHASQVVHARARWPMLLLCATYVQSVMAVLDRDCPALA